MDTDFHKIIQDGKQVNLPAKIRIGNHVWVGCRNTILKGVHIPDGCVLAANSNVVKSIDQEFALIGGNPAHILKTNVEWQE